MVETALVAAGTILATKAIEKTGEKLTEEVIDAVLPSAKAWLATQGDGVKAHFAALGDRVLGRLPEGANPFEDPVLLAEIVAEETRDPAVKALVDQVASALPAIAVENWKGVNIKGGKNTISGNTFNF
jgi:hypothetical protein